MTLQAPSSTSAERGREQLGVWGQQAGGQHQYGNNNPSYGKGSTISINHSQQQLNLSLQKKKKNKNPHASFH